MYTKRQLIREAHTELGLGLDFDITAEEEQAALRRLDAMLALWEGKGVRIGYAFPTDPTASDPDTPSGIPDMHVQTVAMSLAVLLAPSFGKAVHPTTKAAAKDGYDLLLLAAARPQQQQMPNTMPKGAGNRSYFHSSAYYPTPDTSPIQQADNGGLEFLQE